MTQTSNQYAMQNPLTQYPQPTFEDQPQSAPGLAHDMVPKPDNGERSYQGFGRLAGRRAVITGADSGIGRAVAIAFAREGADIVLNYLPSEESDARAVVKAEHARTFPRISSWLKLSQPIVFNVPPKRNNVLTLGFTGRRTTPVTAPLDRADASEWQAEHRLNSIFRLLGPPPRRAMLRVSPTLIRDKASWECGCMLDYNVDDGDGAFAWQVCSAHSELTGASVLASGTART